jgi:hypothetical protein
LRRVFSQDGGAVNSASAIQFGGDNVASRQVGDRPTLSVVQNSGRNQAFSVQLGDGDGLNATRIGAGALGDAVGNSQVAANDAANVASQRGFNDIVANSLFSNDETLTVASQDSFGLAIANVQAGPGDAATLSLQTGWADRIANGHDDGRRR